MCVYYSDRCGNGYCDRYSETVVVSVIVFVIVSVDPLFSVIVFVIVALSVIVSVIVPILVSIVR